MSGHSKWANIKNKKGESDAKRASVFTKIGREIAVAVKQGGPDPNSNARLRVVIGAMGTSGCVSYMFETKGVIIVEGEGKDEDEVMMIALDCGANDIQSDEDVFEIYTDPTSLGEVREAIEKEGTLKILSAQVDRIPSSTVKPDKETEAKVIKLLDMLEDNDDVQNVYHNAELEEEDEEE